MPLKTVNARGLYEPPGVGALTRQTLESLVDLVGAQIRLAKAEISVDSRSFVQRTTKLLLFTPLLLTGYLFVCAAVSALLAPTLGWAASFGLVALLNLAAGGIGAAMAWTKVKRIEAIPQTVASVSESVHQIEAAFHSPG